jgi:hypothetical protein
VGTGRSVILAGGDPAKNIFWHVGSVATINGIAHTVGTIFANAGLRFRTAAPHWTAEPYPWFPPFHTWIPL